MNPRIAELLDEIQQDALDATKPLNDVLRKCVALGGEAGSEALRSWATRELKGYGPDDTVPDYRIIPATIQMDYMTPGAIFKGEQISALQLPAQAREKIKEEVEVRVPLAEIVDVAITARARDEAVKFSLPVSSAMVPIMNAEYASEHPSARRKITSVYWAVHSGTCLSIADVVRTTVVEPVASLRPISESISATSGGKEADKVVNVVLHGDGNNLTFNQSDSKVWKTVHLSKPESSGRLWMYWIGGILAILASLAGIVEFFTHL
jgi:hypothetical protein